MHLSSGEASPERLPQDPVSTTPAPERSTQRLAGTAAAPERGSAIADKEMEEVFGGLPRLTEKEHMCFGQLDEDGLPEVMDEEMEEATIKELQRLAVATGRRLNVSRLPVHSW